MMPAQRHGGGYGGEADDSSSHSRERPREAELSGLCNLSRRPTAVELQLSGYEPKTPL